MRKLGFFALTAVLLAMSACTQSRTEAAGGNTQAMSDENKVTKTDAQWRKELTPTQYHVLREKGTEPSFTGEYHNVKKPGMYVCAACGQPLFSSDTKYDSGTGWPSFYAPAEENNVDEKADWGFGMVRTEVLCSRCGGHLGHIFKDGPEPTGLRYCINSAALKLIPEEQETPSEP